MCNKFQDCKYIYLLISVDDKTPVARSQFYLANVSDAYLNDASYAAEVFGYPAVSANTLIRWQAEWLIDGGRSLGKPTHFEERKGTY